MIEIDASDFIKSLNNAVKYGEAYIQEINARRLWFNKELGQQVVLLLGQYIDAQARLDPSSLHHVYEPGAVGNQSARLFDFDFAYDETRIALNGTFLESTGGEQPFRDKASIMESGISVTIEPKDAAVLAFEVDGETVFTAGPVFVEHPGGPEVAGSFKAAIESFMSGYLIQEIINPLMNRMSKMTEFANSFPSGVKLGGSPGRRAARQYLDKGDKL